MERIPPRSNPPPITPAAVDAAVPKIGGTPIADCGAFWEGIRDHTHRHFVAATERGMALWRLSVKPTAPYRDLGGEQMIEWGGALRWLVAGPRTDSREVRAWAHGNGGHATLFRASDKSAARSIRCRKRCISCTAV